MEEKTRYRIGLGVLLFLHVLVLCGIYYQVCKSSIPDEIGLAIHDSSQFDYKIPAIGIISSEEGTKKSVNLHSQFTLTSNEKGTYTMETKLFGLVKLKEVAIKAKERQTAAPSGKITGIYIETKGLFVVDTAQVNTASGVKRPAENKLSSGDYIMKINGVDVTSKMKFMEQVDASKGKSIVLTVNRKNKVISVKLTPQKDESDGQYKIGAYIRNNTQGIGTITYTQGKKFAALGHGISDIDLGSLLSIRGGEIYEAEITDIKRGKAGSPGEIVGMIDYQKNNFRGNIEKNTQYGIFGTFSADELKKEKRLPVALKQEVKKGKAKIISYISGERKEYDIVITDVDKGNKEKLKGMEIRVKDKGLKELTSGIVQGMSGSPIVQNGKLVGAVTHVFVSDPTKGYGIFAESMLEHQ